MCKHAKDAALAGVKLAITLLISRTMLLLGPAGYDTYYNMQVASAIPEIIGAVLITGAIGAIWLQTLHKDSEE
jgi:hypothetical protein